jgi:hypothetical protein
MGMNERSIPEIEKMLDTGLFDSTDDWWRVKNYLAQSFAEYLGLEVEPVWEPIYEDFSPAEGFAFGIRSRIPFAHRFAIEWYGAISYSREHTCAAVLLFAQDQRIIPVGNEFLHFVFTTTPEGAREWQNRGWTSGECGEWEGYRRLSEVCRRMRKSNKVVWIHCESAADVGSPERLAAQASGGRHVALQFPSLHPDEMMALVSRLSAALPNHSVFVSGAAQVMIMRVVAARLLGRRAEILQAVADYRHACATLVEQYQADVLPSVWRAIEHGDHCRFTNRRTGQIVEAPVPEWTDPNPVDPYFFAEFVKTTAGLESVAELIENYFHDGWVILDFVGALD